MRVRASAPGKLILLGEYAVLEGAPALVMAANRFAEVTIEPISSPRCLVDAPEIGISDLPFAITEKGQMSFPSPITKEAEKKLSFLSAGFEYAHKIRKQGLGDLPAFKVKLDTSQFFNRKDNQKLGLGSSAAITAALISALTQFGNERIKPPQQSHQIFEATLRAHRKAQGNIGSGIDVAASVFGGVLQYQIADKEFVRLPFVEKLTIPANLHILIVWTGKTASTARFVQEVETFKRTESKDFETIINKMSAISNSGIEAFKIDNSPQFLEAAKQYLIEMKKLGEKSGIPIVSEIHQRISEIVMDSGGVYKPSGAGGGDLGVAFFADAKIQKEITKKLRNGDFETLNLEIAAKGFQVLTM